MKTFILCGGFGTRLDLEGKNIPKALVKIGNQPILIHLIENFIDQDFNEFVICLGYKKKLIENYFFKHFKKIDLIKKKKYKIFTTKINNKIIKIFLVDTYLNTGTGGRIKIANKILNNKKDFLMTYCDGLANINLKKLIKSHKKSKKFVTVTAVQPYHRYGILKIKNNLVIEFNNENPKQNIRINGGFFIIKPKALKFVKENKIFWENEPMNKLINSKQLNSFKHNYFWSSLDTQKDKKFFNDLWKSKKLYWKKII